MRRDLISPTPNNRKRRVADAWITSAVKALITADTSELPHAHVRFKEMVANLGFRPGEISDRVRIEGIDAENGEISDEAGDDVDVLRRLLHRHEETIGLPGQVFLSGLIHRRDQGLPATNTDLARLTDLRARLRLKRAGRRA